MTELDKIRAEIEARLQKAARDRDAAQERLDDIEGVVVIASAELAAHDRAVAAMGAPAADNPRTRHSVQRPVMALFSGRGVEHRAELIISTTELPETAVRKFLARAVKAGALALSSDGYYRLPPELGEPLIEAAK